MSFIFHSDSQLVEQYSLVMTMVIDKTKTLLHITHPPSCIIPKVHWHYMVLVAHMFDFFHHLGFLRMSFHGTPKIYTCSYRWVSMISAWARN